MNILLANDDGYRAEGLARLREALKDFGAITVVAPDRNRSGASNSLTLDMPLCVQDAGDGVWYVINGTPTDCVHLAISGLFETEFDMVVSGINDGSNLGDDVLYSGTVAAAIEGRFLGLPTVAISLVVDQGSNIMHFDTAARVVHDIVQRILMRPLDSSMILNINVPNRPYDELKGIEVTRLGYRHRSEPVVKSKDPRGRTIYWVGPAGLEQDAGPGTDFHAVAAGFVSVTPLQIDLTRHAAIAALARWLEGDGRGA